MTTKAQAERERIEANKREAYTRKVKSLIGHVAGRLSEIKGLPYATIATAYGAGVSAEDYAAMIAAQEPVGRALHPAKVEAVKSAAATAQRIVEGVRKTLEEHGWDMNSAAPQPDSFRMGRSQYQTAQSRRRLFEAVTRKPGGGHHSGLRGQPRIVEMDDEGVANFIRHSEADAALQYDMFIVKMVSKVGEVEDAEITGDHIWGHSILIVTLKDGSVQRWKTQQIVNYSVYGRPYLQWPSRIVK